MTVGGGGVKWVACVQSEVKFKACIDLTLGLVLLLWKRKKRKKLGEWR